MLFVKRRRLAGLSRLQLDAIAAEHINLAHSVAPRFDLDDLILPESDPSVVAYLAACKARPIVSRSASSQSKRRRSTEADSWGVTHLDFCNKTNQSFWEPNVPPETVMDDFPGLRDITLRQFDILALKAGLTGFPDTGPRVFDMIGKMLNQSFFRKKGVNGYTVASFLHFQRCSSKPIQQKQETT